MKILAAAAIAVAAAMPAHAGDYPYLQRAAYPDLGSKLTFMLFNQPHFEDMPCTLPAGKRTVLYVSVRDAGKEDTRYGCWASEPNGDIRVQLYDKRMAGSEIILDKRWVTAETQ